MLSGKANGDKAERRVDCLVSGSGGTPVEGLKPHQAVGNDKVVYLLYEKGADHNRGKEEAATSA